MIEITKGKLWKKALMLRQVDSMPQQICRLIFSIAEVMIFCSHNLNKIFLFPVESYVRSLAQPSLLDLVVVPTSGDVTMEDVEDHRPSKKKVIYSEVC